MSLHLRSSDRFCIGKYLALKILDQFKFAMTLSASIILIEKFHTKLRIVTFQKIFQYLIATEETTSLLTILVEMAQKLKAYLYISKYC